MDAALAREAVAGAGLALRPGVLAAPAGPLSLPAGLDCLPLPQALCSTTGPVFLGKLSHLRVGLRASGRSSCPRLPPLARSFLHAGPVRSPAAPAGILILAAPPTSLRCAARLLCLLLPAAGPEEKSGGPAALKPKARWRSSYPSLAGPAACLPSDTVLTSAQPRAQRLRRPQRPGFPWA